MKNLTIALAVLAIAASYSSNSLGQDYYQFQPRVRHQGHHASWGNQGIQPVQDRPVLRLLTQVANNATQAQQIQQAQNQLAFQRIQLNSQRTQQQMIQHNAMVNQQRQAMLNAQHQAYIRQQMMAQQQLQQTQAMNRNRPIGIYQVPKSTPDWRLLGDAAGAYFGQDVNGKHREIKQSWDNLRDSVGGIKTPKVFKKIAIFGGW